MTPDMKTARLQMWFSVWALLNPSAEDASFALIDETVREATQDDSEETEDSAVFGREEEASPPGEIPGETSPLRSDRQGWEE